MFVKVFSANDLVFILNELVEHQDHEVDLISDTSFSVSLRQSVDNIKINDLVSIQENNKDFYYVVDKVDRLDNSIQCKSVLNVFDQDLRLVNTDITLYQLFDTYFKNPADPYQRINWLNIDLVNNSLKIKVNATTAESGLNSDNDVFNLKKIVIDTILANRFNLNYVNDLNNNVMKLAIQPQNTLNTFNLNNPMLVNQDYPELGISTNTVDIHLTKTREVDVLTEDGTTTTKLVEVLTRNTQRWVLLDNNTVSTNLLSATRVLPPRIETLKITHDELEPPDTQKEAENILIDVSNKYISFELTDSRKSYNKDYLIGDLVQLYYQGRPFRAILTGIQKKQNTTLFKFGRNRLDIIFKIKKRV